MKEKIISTITQLKAEPSYGIPNELVQSMADAAKRLNELPTLDFITSGALINSINEALGITLEKAKEFNVPIICSMGAGNRINPLELYACDISEIKNKKDTFVQNILYQLGKKGITSGIDVVISNEKARKPEKIVNTEHIITNSGEEVEFRKITPSSTPFVASCAGIVISSIIVRKIMENN